jgi:hypothetical protein
MPIHKDKPSRTRRVLCFDPPTLNEAIFAAQGSMMSKARGRSPQG